jgi:predicted O-methyltransferase YrrM
MIRQRFTRTWIKADGAWRLLASHRSAFPASGPDSPPLPESDTEKLIIETAEQAPRHANVPLADARLLRVLAESMGAKNVVELGTSTGYSGLWLSNALRKTGGKLTTFELDPDRAATAREHFKRAGVDNIITLMEGDAHKNLEKVKGPIDLAFVDAEKDGYKQYLEQLLPKMRPGGLILAHNMRFPTPSPDFIQAATTNPALDTIFLNMDDRGMAVSLKKR